MAGNGSKLITMAVFVVLASVTLVTRADPPPICAPPPDGGLPVMLAEAFKAAPQAIPLLSALPPKLQAKVCTELLKKQLCELTADQIKKDVQKLIPILKQIPDMIKSLKDAKCPEILAKLKELLAMVKAIDPKVNAILAGLKECLLPLIKKLLEKLKAKAIELLEKLKSVLATLVPPPPPALMKAIDKAIEFLKKTPAEMLQAIKDAAMKLIAKFPNLIPQVMQVLKAMFPALKPLLENPCLLSLLPPPPPSKK